MIDQEKLKEVIAFARSNGLKSVELDGIKMEIGDTPISLEPDGGKDIIQITTPYDDLTDEEMDLWATPYFDELMERKKARKEALMAEEQVRD